MRYSNIPPHIIVLLANLRKKIPDGKYMPYGMVAKVAIHYGRDNTQIYAMMKQVEIYQERIRAMEPDKAKQAEKLARQFLGLPDEQQSNVTKLPVREGSIRAPTKIELMGGRSFPKSPRSIPQ